MKTKSKKSNVTKSENVTTHVVLKAPQESEVRIAIPRATRRATLEATKDRVSRFIRAIGKDPALFALMESAGYTQEDHNEASVLLATLAQHRKLKKAYAGSPAEAFKQLEQWDRGLLRRIRAALVRLHPEEEKMLFEDLPETRAATALQGISTFLHRVSQLENAGAAGHAVLATLSQRSFGKAERERLQALIEQAQSVPVAQTIFEHQAAYDAALNTLRAWFEDWSETARTLCTRRADLAALGLAKARTAVSAEPPPEQVTPGAPVVPVVVPVMTVPSGTGILLGNSGVMSNGAVYTNGASSRVVVGG